MRVKIASSALIYLCWIGIVLIPVVVASVWILGDHVFFQSGEPTHYLIPHGYALRDAPISLSVRTFGFLASMVPNALLLFALWQLKHLFQQFKSLRFFTLEAAQSLQKFAVAVLLYAVIYPLSSGLLSLATSINNPPGYRVISITAGDSQVFAIFLGLVILVVSWVMGEAEMLVDENRHFV